MVIAVTALSTVAMIAYPVLFSAIGSDRKALLRVGRDAAGQFAVWVPVKVIAPSTYGVIGVKVWIFKGEVLDVAEVTEAKTTKKTATN